MGAPPHTEAQPAVVAFLVWLRRERCEPITERLVATLVTDHPAYRGHEVVPLAALERSCRANVDRVLELLAVVMENSDGREAHDDWALASADARYFDAARSTGQERAEQGLPLDDVLRSFRIGGRLIWDDLVDVGGETLDVGALRDIGTWLWRVVDATSAAVAASYHLQLRSLVRADEQHRAQLWEGLLGGRARDPGFAHDAGQLLDLPVVGDLVVAVAPRLDFVEADRLLAPHATAWMRRAGEVVGLVALRDDDPDEVYAALGRVAERQRAPMGVSTTMAGLAAVEDGLRQASLTLRAQGSTVGLACFDDRLPESMLLTSPDVAERLLSIWVRPLLALGQEGRLLLDTLVAWVAAGGSASRAGELAHCHRNTVLNRLARIATVTRRPFVDGVPPLDLDLALRAWRMGLAPSSAAAPSGTAGPSGSSAPAAPAP